MRSSRLCDAAAPDRFLLQGVTGSGKTEVYLQAMAKSSMRGAAPSCSFPKSRSRLRRSRTSTRTSASGSPSSTAVSRWGRGTTSGGASIEGEVSIVIGARSAVFAPVRNLAMIILDEEHETSYKQEESPRYHARDVAWARARHEGAVLILGSATPAVEVRAAAEAGEYTLLELPFRVHARPLPSVEVVDMRGELLAGNRSMFSRSLAEKLEATLGPGRAGPPLHEPPGPRVVSCSAASAGSSPDATLV